MATTTRFSNLLLDIPYTELCFVEGGTFNMGDGSDKDNPSHKVTLSDFGIGRYPVTQVLYETVMGNNPSHFKGKNHPVERVSWFDAIAFCNKLSLKQGKTPCYYSDVNYKKVVEDIANFKNNTVVYLRFHTDGYRLPTEAEWEYAAKSGNSQDKYKFSGSDQLYEVGWFCDNSHNKTHPVGLKKANSLGIYDLSGNIYEWCHELHTNIYKMKFDSNTEAYCIVRGGCWYVVMQHCRSTARLSYKPLFYSSNVGFRICCRSLG